MDVREKGYRVVDTDDEGVMRLDMVEIVGKFGLMEWKKAFEVAKEKADMGQMVLIIP